MAKWTARWGYKEPPPTLVVSYQNQAVAELTKEKGRFLFRYLEPFFAQDLVEILVRKIGFVFLGGIFPFGQHVFFEFSNRLLLRDTGVCHAIEVAIEQ